jgi:hypothetical protein
MVIEDFEDFKEPQDQVQDQVQDQTRNRRFNLVLNATLYEDFLRAYPNHGTRSEVLRACIKRLVEKRRLVGFASQTIEATEVADVVVGLKRFG